MVYTNWSIFHNGHYAETCSALILKKSEPVHVYSALVQVYPVGPYLCLLAEVESKTVQGENDYKLNIIQVIEIMHI